MLLLNLLEYAESKMTQLELSDLTGVGLRFVRDFEQGKPNLMTAKVNQVLLFFLDMNYHQRL